MPAQLVAFDLLAIEGEDLRSEHFSVRREHLEKLAAGLAAPWNLTPTTTDVSVAQRWFREYEAAGCDGVVAKRLEERYESGKRKMIKIKHRRHVDCVVGGYRVHKDGDKIGSLLLGLYNDEGSLHFIGHCSGFADADRAEMLTMFESLRSPRLLRCPGESPGRPEPLVDRQEHGVDAGPTRGGHRDQATTSFRTTDSATPPGSIGGDPTNRRWNAPWTSWKDLRDRASRKL